MKTKWVIGYIIGLSWLMLFAAGFYLGAVKMKERCVADTVRVPVMTINGFVYSPTIRRSGASEVADSIAQFSNNAFRAVPHEPIYISPFSGTWSAQQRNRLETSGGEMIMRMNVWRLRDTLYVQTDRSLNKFKIQ